MSLIVLMCVALLLGALTRAAGFRVAGRPARTARELMLSCRTFPLFQALRLATEANRTVAGEGRPLAIAATDRAAAAHGPP